MKTTYLVKKNPEQPTGNDNWIIMDGKQFTIFRESEEGKRRSNNFIKLCTEYDEECIVMECDLSNLKKWKAEINHAAYVQKVNKESGYQIISYHQFESEESDIDGEAVLIDDKENFEDIVLNKIEIEKLLRLVNQLSDEDKKLIYSFYLTEYPMTDTAFGKENGISRQLVHLRKERALERLKKLYFS